MIYYYSSSEHFEQRINLNNLLRNIDSNKNVFNFNGFDTFIDNWKEAFISTYRSEERKEHYFKQENCFRESLFIDSQEIRLHFNIDKANQAAYGLEIQHIPSYAFGCIEDNYNNQPPIKYSAVIVNGNSYNYSSSTIPVITINFCHSGFDYLVIDGNHRISAKKKSKIDIIDTVLLTPKQTLSIMYSEFEKAIFLYLFEGFLLSKEKYDIINHSMSSSFLI